MPRNEPPSHSPKDFPEMEVWVDGKPQRRPVESVQMPSAMGMLIGFVPTPRLEPILFENERAEHLLDGRVIIIKVKQ